MIYIGLFLMCFMLVYFLYLVFVVRKAKRRNSKYKPVEVKYLVSKYKFDIKKINYKRLLYLISFISSFDISLVFVIVCFINSYVLKIILILFLSFPIVLLSYHMVGIYYVKKGMIIDE